MSGRRHPGVGALPDQTGTGGADARAHLQQAAVPIAWVVADTVYGGNLDLRTWCEQQLSLRAGRAL